MRKDLSCRRKCPISISNLKLSPRTGPVRETTPCGAKVKKGELFLHIKNCPDPLCSGIINKLNNAHQ